MARDFTLHLPFPSVLSHNQPTSASLEKPPSNSCPFTVWIASLLEDEINQCLERLKTCKLREELEEQRAGSCAVPRTPCICATATLRVRKAGSPPVVAEGMAMLLMRASLTCSLFKEILIRNHWLAFKGGNCWVVFGFGFVLVFFKSFQYPDGDLKYLNVRCSSDREPNDVFLTSCQWAWWDNFGKPKDT